MPKCLFVYEELTALGPWLDASLAPLLPEGLALAKALVNDLSLVDGINTTVMVHPEFASGFPCFNKVQKVITDKTQLENPFMEQEYKETLALIIAPETGGLLETRTTQAEHAGLTTLNCGKSSLKISSDKWQTFLHWKSQNVPTPLTFLLKNSNAKDFTFPVVIKPRDGAGACDTFLVNNETEFSRLKQLLKNNEFIAQPLCPGKAVSVTFIATTNGKIPLMAGEQNIENGKKIEYLGGTIPLYDPLKGRAIALANKALEGLKDLNGWVGIDLVLGESPYGVEDFAIEINPRLTTSYLGIRNLIPGATLMKLLLGYQEEIPAQFPQKTISFKKNGEIIKAAH